MQETEETIVLKPIIEPIPIDFTMETLGWKVLFMLLIFFVLYSAYKYYLHYRNNKYRRDAISKIQSIVLESNTSIPSLITQVMYQLKQTALISFGRKKVASLEGEEWLSFLDKSVKGVQFNKYQEIISLAVYKELFKDKIPFDKDIFIKSSLHWIRKHAR